MITVKEDKKTKNKLIFLFLNISINAFAGLNKNINVKGNIENNKFVNVEYDIWLL